MRKAYKIIACVLVISIFVALVYNNYGEAISGSYTAETCLISKQSQQWIEEQFGDCETFEELLKELTDFSINNFNYYIYDEKIQHFNYDELRLNGFKGCCYDYAIFTKSTVNYWSILKKQNIKSYVVDVIFKDGETRHSYNYFLTNENKLYCVDLTSVSSRPAKVDTYVYEVTCCDDYLDHCKKCYKDKVYFIH
ncbi:MAG: hypothetical protein IKW45_04820 [Clostridia bacterium]|nr:hypothetical protein [Clostridia bacterium]